MPSSSAKQSRFMAAIAHSPSFAKKVGVSQSVGKDFNAADKGKTFARGGVTQQKINKQNTRHGMMDLPVANLNRFAGLKKGGIMKKRRFDEGGDVDMENAGYDKSGEGEDAVYRKSFATGVTASNETPAPAKPAAKAVTPPAAKRNLDSAGSSKVSPAQEAVLQRMERDKARGTTSANRDPDVRRLFSAVKPAAAKTDSSFGNYFKDLVTKTRAERYAEANPKKLAKGGAVMKEPKDAMMPRRPRGMAPPVAPQSPMGMGMKKGGAVMKESKGMMGKEVAFMKKKGAPASMIKHEKAEMGTKKGGMPMKDGKPAFMKKFAKGGGIESRGKTKGTIIRMASGGSVSSASRRADGIAQRGKTRC